MLRTMLLTVAALSLAGCMTSRAHEGSATHSAMEPAAAQPGTGGSEMSAMCPLAVAGTTVREQDIEGGGALVFTTTQGDVMELRRRVAHMADMHNQHVATHQQREHQGTGGAGPGPAMEIPNAQARVEDIEGGARVVYTPKDPAQVPALREELVRHASRMGTGSCPMMKMHGHEKEMRQCQP